MIRRFIRRWLYRLYLRLPWWQHTRRLALARAGGRCSKCGEDRALQVHHLRYQRGGRSVLWRERAGDLQVLCRRCHAAAHRAARHA